VRTLGLWDQKVVRLATIISPKDTSSAPGSRSKAPAMWANKLRVLLNKMAGSNGTLIAMRMVRSKLRKREESNNNNNNNNNSRRHGNNAVHPQDGVVATTPVLTAKSVDLPVVANGQR